MMKLSFETFQPGSQVSPGSGHGLNQGFSKDGGRVYEQQLCYFQGQVLSIFEISFRNRKLESYVILSYI